jgi:hypothetical protein
MYWYPTRDLYIVIHLSLLYPCAKSILSLVSYIYTSKYNFIIMYLEGYVDGC